MGGLQQSTPLGVRCVLLTIGLSATTVTTAHALVPVGGGGGGGPSDTPGSVQSTGPALPYISGRLGGARQAPSSVPSGTVVPDDFCLPGKFDDCGSHLREAATEVVDGPIFVGGEDLAFYESKNSVWASGEFRQTSISSLSESHSTTSYSLGYDRKFGDDFVLGATLMNSTHIADFNTTGIQDRSTGFFAGPYFAFRLSDNLFLDGRFHMGTSSHSVTTAGAQTGKYDSQDSFGALRISAEMNRGKWAIYPALEIAHVVEDSAAYTDSLRGPVAATSTSQSFATATVLGYYNGFETVTPYLGLEVSTELGANNVFGTFRAGASTAFGNGSNLNIDYAYGGIGLNGTDDQQLSIRFEIPF